jgi:hypothetical protein
LPAVAVAGALGLPTGLLIRAVAEAEDELGDEKDEVKLEKRVFAKRRKGA